MHIVKTSAVGKTEDMCHAWSRELQEYAQAVRNATQELRELVGIRWALGKCDPQRAREAGLDCLGLMVAGYDIIGRYMAEPDRWTFPVPQGYPYESELPDGSWIPEADIGEWSRHFIGVMDPVFGASVTLNADHIGILIEPRRGRGFDILHTPRHKTTVIHPMARLQRWITGIYVLRTTREDEP